MKVRIKALAKGLWGRCPHWPRKWRVVRNLMLSGLLLLTLPWLLEWPDLTDEGVFRHLERTALLSPSQLVLREGDAFLTEGEDWVTVGKLETYGNWVRPFQHKQPYINYVIPKGELIVVALPEVVDGTLTVAVTGLPDEAASGTLSLTISDVRNPHEDFAQMEEQETFTASTARRGDWMFFRLEPHEHGGNTYYCMLEVLWHELSLGRGLDQYPYTLALRDSNGGLIELTEGELPQEQRFLNGQFLL